MGEWQSLPVGCVLLDTRRWDGVRATQSQDSRFKCGAARFSFKDGDDVYTRGGFALLPETLASFYPDVRSSITVCLTCVKLTFLSLFYFLFCYRVDYSLTTFSNRNGVWKVLLDGPGRKQLVHGQARSIQQPRVTGWADIPARWQQEGRSLRGRAEDSSERPWRTGAPPLRRQISTLLRSLRTP